MVPCDCLVCVSLGFVPLSGSGYGVAPDLVCDQYLLPGLDGFFGDLWFLRDWQWGRLLVGICFVFDRGWYLYVCPGYGKS